MASDFPVVFALYPDVTQLDFTGPLEVLARLPQARIVLAAAHGGELAAGGVTFADVRPLAQVNECALLCVPGGFGCSAAMVDAEYLGALRRLAARARYVTSVCTGSLLLGAAGLLEGRRAASLGVSGPAEALRRAPGRPARRARWPRVHRWRRHRRHRHGPHDQ